MKKYEKNKMPNKNNMCVRTLYAHMHTHLPIDGCPMQAQVEFYTNCLLSLFTLMTHGVSH